MTEEKPAPQHRLTFKLFKSSHLKSTKTQIRKALFAELRTYKPNHQFLQASIYRAFKIHNQLFIQLSQQLMTKKYDDEGEETKQKKKNNTQGYAKAPTL